MGALSDRQGDGGVSEVVEAQSIQPRGRSRRLPVTLVEDRSPDWSALHVDEHETVAARLGTGSQLLLELVGQEGADADRPDAGAGLGLLPHPPS